MTRQDSSRPNGPAGAVATALAFVAIPLVLGLLLILTTSLVSAAPAPASGDLQRTPNVFVGAVSSDLRLGTGDLQHAGGLSPAATRLRRVNMPYFAGGVPIDQTALFWFGTLSPNTQYGDIRMGYNNSEILINANVMDRVLWYNENAPTPANLATYDSVSIFLSRNTGGLTAPDTNTYRFDAGFTWWETNRSKWQTSFRGTGSSWTLSPISFWTQSGWRGDQPNNLGMDRGWNVTLHIPFSSLGLSGPPAKGTIWKLAVALHNRDNAAGTFIADQLWPETTVKTNPSTWGQLRFGLAPAYTPPTARNLQTIGIRNRQNGQVATTTNVGGYTQCGENIGNFGLAYWQQWGIKNWAGKEFLNVMNQDDIADWACYNKVYAQFPLATIPAGKVITSARLVLYQFGHAGTANQNPGPSLIQLFSTDTGWTPSTINWNNAPKPNENLDRKWAGTGTCLNYKNCPYVAFDVSQQVARAYAAGQPLRLIIYDSDDQISSGKYFFSSETGDWNAANRPTLRVTYGDP